ncbi:ABC-2 type transport system ATP-binding protein [Amycolatopsis pretoriensis]|uniref:ABC-2 type transport system ATP-binding protein n=1 Tax=Amycolatopsis pretoriensis TaxID=218821 RepID=A0A1H5QE21_9PSEU|nr:ABC transporter ATP-binding protein [Amycolatopsis pretoriensis]SEF24296.1 ABC-2 type transport system ATP-binding protein [Amycolatopsis pretoriensis]
MLKDTVIRTRGLRKKYRDTVALDVVDLDVEQGEIFALLGPNGAGKTTLTEILEGFRDRDAGEIDVLGEDPGKASLAWRTRVGVVLQDSQDYAQLTVLEVLTHFASFYPDARRPAELVEAVGLSGHEGKRAVQLSGGQRRRLDVALGLVGRPELLFLDEPTTGFDPEVRRQFWDLVARLREEGTTILLTTHYLDEAEHLADRVGVLSKGGLVDVDTPARLGGRHLLKAIVSWTDDEGPHQVESPNPTRTVLELAARFGDDIPGLAVRRPTLEDVYLSMIGATGD